MPTNTFLNLSETKKQKIIDASIHEFSNYSFDKVSINRIIKEAGISRGSFYMYFEDLYDLALFLVQGIKQKILGDAQVLRNLDSLELDQVLLAYHSVVYDYYNQEVYRNMFRNILLYFQGRPEDELESLKGRIPHNLDFQRFSQIISKKSFRSESPEFVTNVMNMALASFRETLFMTFMLKLNKEQSRKLLKDKLNILQYGYKESSK